MEESCKKKLVFIGYSLLSESLVSSLRNAILMDTFIISLNNINRKERQELR
jgi:hypothetical protein